MKMLLTVSRGARIQEQRPKPFAACVMPPKTMSASRPSINVLAGEITANADFLVMLETWEAAARFGNLDFQNVQPIDVARLPRWTSPNPAAAPKYPALFSSRTMHAPGTTTIARAKHR
jgi:hypothetical protein